MNPTFSDALALVRQQFWNKQQFLTASAVRLPPEAEVKYLNEPLIRHLCAMIVRAA